MKLSIAGTAVVPPALAPSGFGGITAPITLRGAHGVRQLVVCKSGPARQVSDKEKWQAWTGKRAIKLCLSPKST
jgi:hypothetical protein